MKPTMKKPAKNTKKKVLNESSNTASQQDSRRQAMKKLLTVGGIAAGSQMISSEWTRPVVESVVLPAHAQTSTSAASGTFTTGTVITALNRQRQDNNLLDMLIPSAHADDDDVGESICGTSNTNGVMNGPGAYQVMFNISGSNVDVCVSSLGRNNRQDCTTEGSTTIAGNSIANIQYIMDATLDPPTDQEFVDLRNMVVNAAGTQISGQLEITSADLSDTNNICTQNFTADLTASAYACNLVCQDNVT